MSDEVVDDEAAQIVHVGIEGTTTIHPSYLFNEGELASLNIERKGIDCDARSGATKYLLSLIHI